MNKPCRCARHARWLMLAVIAGCGSGPSGGAPDAAGGGDGRGMGNPDGALVGGLPAKIVAGYWQMYQGPKVSEVTANAPQYNLQYAAFALGTSAGTGNVTFDPVFEDHDHLKVDIAASKAGGARWLLSIGGGGEENIRLTTQQQADDMVTTLIPIIDDYGFDGVDFDLESGPDGWSIGPMKSVAVQLKAHYGTSFIVSAAPRPYEDYFRDFAVQAGDALDLFGFQFYDFPEANDTDFLRAYIHMRIDQAVGLGIPASKLMIGCITYSQYSAGHNTVETYRDIFKELETTYPDLRGVYIWETSLDKLDGWSFAHVMGTAVRGL